MNLQPFFRPPLFWLLRMLPGLLAKKIYGPQRITKNILIDLRPRGDQLAIDFRTTEGSLWLTVRNGSPFPVDLDRLSVDLWCSSRLGMITLLNRIQIASSEPEDVLVRGLLLADCGRLAMQRADSTYCTAEVRAEFDSNVGRFVVKHRLDGIKPSFQNTPVS